ncbi:hypothetical protein C0Q70_01803 [Pomacea canaliculata]|uniref:Uncharacterized protein n=1 Tax=Pomacea canaliculata TaxID=400727 RepID=A0A2T7Q0H1_POMCA|nr:hypothetical protein C0Q70_01803 [Pomacea canaliculata]
MTFKTLLKKTIFYFAGDYTSYNASVPPYGQYSTGYPGDPAWSMRYGHSGLLNTPAYYYTHSVRNEPATAAVTSSKT